MILNKKYPLSNSAQSNLRITIGLGVFVSLFLMFFQPFELYEPGIENRYLKIAGYGAITMGLMFFSHYLILPHFDEGRWTVGKEILTITLLIVFIGVGNYLYSVWVFNWTRISILAILRFIGYTLAVGIFPVTILTLLKQNQLDRKYRKDAEIINVNLLQATESNTPNEYLELIGDYKDRLLLIPGNIIYIESKGNYIHIHYMEKGNLQQKELRSSLKNVQNQLTGFEYLFRSHRAFLVNLRQIKKVSGNAQGLRLEMAHVTQEVPVARSRVQTFKQMG